jgi:hypothetical protein
MNTFIKIACVSFIVLIVTVVVAIRNVNTIPKTAVVAVIHPDNLKGLTLEYGETYYNGGQLRQHWVAQYKNELYTGTCIAGRKVHVIRVNYNNILGSKTKMLLYGNNFRGMKNREYRKNHFIKLHNSKNKSLKTIYSVYATE